ncbi:hypothetical protein TIFTF001_002029 [Ficus carica]|uniref:Uncharacterized protein n=1 Tax=Ficus carica TaxID=3494 RepID=A0AA87Z238_FICCA|nr:hypothetical protein TIFTF001_002029 [Ficus carica]
MPCRSLSSPSPKPATPSLSLLQPRPHPLPLSLSLLAVAQAGWLSLSLLAVAQAAITFFPTPSLTRVLGPQNEYSLGILIFGPRTRYESYFNL